MIQRKERLEIRLDGAGLKSGIANIYSVDGRMLDSKTFGNQSSVNFPLSGFSKGVYIIYIKDTETGKVRSRKIII